MLTVETIYTHGHHVCQSMILTILLLKFVYVLGNHCLQFQHHITDNKIPCHTMGYDTKYDFDD